MPLTEKRAHPWVSDVAMVALIAVLAGALLIAGPVIHPGMGTGSLALSSLQFSDLMGMASYVLGVGLLSWWSAALLMAVIGQLLCIRGHVILGGRVSAWSPGFMRRLVLLVLSTNLIAAPAMASTPSQDTASVQTLEQYAGGTQAKPRSAIVVPMWKPTGPQQPDRVAADTMNPRWTPTKSANSGDVLTRGPLRNAEEQTHERTVTVQPGDSLWSLCAEHLGPYATDVEIAAEWPRWYAENQRTIGSDASLLLPGQVLRIPKTSEV